jgi:ribosomal protein L35AE/L33A
VTGNQRGKRNVRVNTSLVQVEGVATKEEAQFYLGKVRRHALDCAGLLGVVHGGRIRVQGTRCGARR